MLTLIAALLLTASVTAVGSVETDSLPAQLERTIEGVPDATEKIPSDRPILLKMESGVAIVTSPDDSLTVVELPTGRYMTELGYYMLNAEITRLQDAETRNLARIESLEADSEFPVKTVLICLAVGLATGAGAVLLLK